MGDKSFELIKQIIYLIGLVVPSWFAYKANKSSKENKVTLATVAGKVDGLLAKKEIADKAQGALEEKTKNEVEAAKPDAVVKAYEMVKNYEEGHAAPDKTVT